MKRPVMIFISAALSSVMFAGEGELTVEYRSVDLWWDSENSSWINNSKTEYLYDNQGNRIESLYRVWNKDAGQWIYPEGDFIFVYYGPARETYSYDTRGNLINYAYYSWDPESGQMIEQYRTESSYNEDGILTDHENKFRDPESGQMEGSDRYQAEFDSNGNLVKETNFYWEDKEYRWVPGWESKYSYDPEGNRTETINSSWEPSLSFWIPDYRETNVYDSTGQMTHTVGYWWNGISWQGQDSTMIIYHAQDLPAEEYRYYRDDETDSWVVNDREQNTYDVNGALSETVTAWWDRDLEEWVNVDRNVHNYNTEGLRLEYAWYTWNEFEEDWEGRSREVNSYNSNSQLEYSLSFRWDYGSWSWIETDRITRSYDSLQNLIQEKSMSMDQDSGKWTGSHLYNYTYDHYGNQTSRTYYNYNEAGGEWIPGSRYVSQWAPIGSRPVYIPDSALLEALIDAGIDSDGDRVITYPEAEAASSLAISGSDVSDLTGLEAFINLDTLECHDNLFQRIDLGLFPGLKYLDCSGCDLKELDVGGLAGLKSLICSHNDLVKLDLTGNLELKVLDLSYLPNLKEVCVWETPFPPEGVEVAVESSQKLKITSDCSIHITSDKLLIALLEQGVDANGDSLISLSEAKAVSELDLSGYRITSFSGLEEFTNIQKLVIRDNPYVLPDLTAFPRLTYFDCSGSLLSMFPLDLTGVPLLTTLICRGCDLGYLDVSENSRLSYLDCAENYLYELSLIRNTNLKYLDVSSMPYLGEICVPETPYPPEGIEVHSENSLEIHYESECDIFQDRFEDNDFLWEAVPVSDNQVYEELAVSEYDGDWFYLIPESETLPVLMTVQCNFLHSEGDINLDIVRADGTLAASAESKNDNETVSIPVNPMEGIYMHVYLDSGLYNDYSLQLFSEIYIPNSTLHVCDPSDLCLDCSILPSMRDTVYTLDTLYIELNTGDSVSRNISIQNMGPESYAFFTSVDCSGMLDGNNYAMKFDGIDDRILINRSEYIDLTDEITLEAWVWFEEGEEGLSPILSRMISGYGYELFSESRGEEFAVGFKVDGGGIVSSRNLSAHHWYHLAATYDSHAIRLYIDGIKDCERAVTGPFSVANQWLVIGANSPMEMDPKYFTGEIDEVRIWNTARNAIQIQCFYQRQLNGSEEGLAGYWNMDHQYETVVIDLTDHNRGYIQGEATRIPSDAPSERLLQIEPISDWIPEGSVYQFQIGVNAAQSTGGLYGINVNLYSDIQEKPDIRIPVLISILDAPSIRVTPDGVAFGQVEMYRTYSSDLEVSNTGSELLSIDSISTGMPGSRITPPSFTLMPGESRNVTLDFFTRFTGSYEGMLRFYTNDPSDPTVEITTTANAAGMSNFAYLYVIRDTLRPGKQMLHILEFEVPNHNCGLTMTHSLRYLKLPGLCYDQIPKEDSGQWVLPVLSSMVVLHPDSVLKFGILVDASDLSVGEYYAELVLEWYNPFREIGYIPISLVVGPTGTGSAIIAPEKEGLLLFPNPTNGILTVRTNEHKPFDLLIMTVDGHVLRQVRVHDPEVDLDVSDLHHGLYLVIMRGEEYVGSRKFIRQ